MQIKTISTVAGVNEIDFGNDSSQSTAHFYWFKNLGNSTLYVSAKPNPVAGEDNVAELSVKGAASIETDEGKVYVLGSGKVEIHRTNSKFCPFELPSTGSGGGSSITIDSELSETSTNPAENRVITGAINDLSNSMLNPNLLINPDFSINQRNNGGIVIGGGAVDDFFIADRWKLYINNTSSSGRIMRNDDGSITLSMTKSYGDIEQVFETPIKEGYYTLSAKINGEIRTHTGYLAKGAQITSNDQGLVLDETSFRVRCLQGQTVTVEWAKLEIGSAATPFSPPNPTTELIKCQRYYQVHNLARQRIWYYTADMLAFFLPNKVPMRSGCTATINGTLAIFALDNRKQSDFNFVIEWAIADGIKVCANKTAHGLTDAILYVNGLPSSGQIEIDAEIY